MILVILKWLFLHLRLATSLIEEFLPSMPSWPVVAFSLVFSVYWYGHSHGVDACQAKQEKIEQNASKKHDKIQTNNDKLIHNQLVNRLRHWQRK